MNAFSLAEASASRPPLSDTPLREDCVFGPATQRALISFQQRVFPGVLLEHDGRLGPKTWAEFDRVAAAPPGPLPPVPVPPVPVPAAQGCSDADIAAALGIRADTSRDGLFGFDSQFAGASGTAFRDRIPDDRAGRRAGPGAARRQPAGQRSRTARRG